MTEAPPPVEDPSTPPPLTDEQLAQAQAQIAQTSMVNNCAQDGHFPMGADWHSVTETPCQCGTYLWVRQSNPDGPFSVPNGLPDGTDAQG